MSQIEISIFRKIITHPAFLLIFAFFAVAFSRVAAEVPFQALWPARGRFDYQEVIVASIAAGASVLVYWLIVRFVERKPFDDFSLPGAGREWGFGLALGVGAMAASVGVIALLGGYRIIGFNGPGVLVNWVAVAIISGIFEEILLRGVVFRYIEQWLGSITALLFSAALFGLLHIGNPNANWISTFAIAIEAGILLAAVYMVTRRLWAVIGLHMAWNFTQGGILGVAVSGFKEDGIAVSQMDGSALLTGGAFGAEASLPAMIICTAMGLYFLWLAYQRGDFVRASWSRFKTGRDA
jgi:uncharacterized protein